MDIYTSIRELAKSIHAQNLFIAAKDISSIKLFKNNFNFSKIQEFYLNWLYNYDVIFRDILIEKISKHVTDNNIYTDAYLLWRKENINKKDKSSNKRNDVSLVVGKTINFPAKEDK
jgi:hypothetical protein